MRWSVVVPGTPKPKGSKTAYVTRAGHASLTESAGQPLKDWRGNVRDYAQQARPEVLLEGPVQVLLLFWLPRPLSERPKRKAWRRAHPRKPDLDKLTRAVLDELSGVVYRDDGQVAQLVAHKWWAAEDGWTGCAVCVVEADEDYWPGLGLEWRAAWAAS